MENISIVILEELGNQNYILKCAVCNGSWEMSRDHDGRSPYRICTACLGVGAQPITGSMKLMR